MTIYMTAPESHQTLTSVLDTIYAGAEASDYTPSIQRYGAERTATSDLVNFIQQGWAFEQQGDAALVVFDELEGHAVWEVGVDDIIAYYRERGWAQ
jgi:F0F1-type ATP synthase alpha subunit